MKKQRITRFTRDDLAILKLFGAETMCIEDAGHRRLIRAHIRHMELMPDGSLLFVLDQAESRHIFADEGSEWHEAHVHRLPLYATSYRLEIKPGQPPVFVSEYLNKRITLFKKGWMIK